MTPASSTIAARGQQANGRGPVAMNVSSQREPGCNPPQPKHLGTIFFDFLILGWPRLLATGVAKPQDVLRPEAPAVGGPASRFGAGLDPLPGWEPSRLV